jgi:ribonuclease P protein subunit RPR2
MPAETVKSKEIKGVTNKHLYSRISYLYQAAQYLASASSNVSVIAVSQKDGLQPLMNDQPTAAQYQGVPLASSSNDSSKSSASCALPRGESERGQPSNPALRLSSHLLAVCRRAKVKASHDLKRSICKRCNELLVPGKTAIIRMENKSKRKRKPWADVLVAECQRCGFEKRYPVGQERQCKKKDRVVVQASGQT